MLNNKENQSHSSSKVFCLVFQDPSWQRGAAADQCGEAGGWEDEQAAVHGCWGATEQEEGRGPGEDQDHPRKHLRVGSPVLTLPWQPPSTFSSVLDKDNCGW